MIFLAIFLLIILVFLFAYIIYSIISDIKGAPFVPSSSKSVDQMIKMADLKPGEKLIDLGSGDGRIVFLAAKNGFEAHGVDVNLMLILWSKVIAFCKGEKRAHFSYKNIFAVDLSQYDVITLYCLPRTIKKLEEKFMKEMKPTARIVSNTFNLNQAQVVRQEGKIKVYKY